MPDDVARLQHLLTDELGAGVLLASADAVIAAPASEEQVQELLACCQRHDLRVIPTGSRLTDGSAQSEDDAPIWCTTSRMCRVLDIAATDLTARVQAGCTISELNSAICKHDLMCPIDPAAPHTTSVGAMIAANRCGPTAREDGTVGDHVLASAVVTPAFGRIRAGAPTTKSVAGYDVHRLMVGSHGQYGIVTEATLRLIPRPVAWTFGCTTARGPQQLRRMLNRLWIGRTRPVVIDVLESIAADDLGLSCAPGELILCIGYRGEPAVIAWQLSTVAEDISAFMDVIDGTAATALYERLRDWSTSPADASFEAAVRLERCIPMITFCQRANIAAIARAGFGVVHGRAVGDMSASDVLALRATAGEDSTVVFDRAPDNGAYKRWPPMVGANWLQHIKDLFDPAGVLPRRGLADRMNDE